MSALHPNLQELLSRLRHQVRRYILWESVLVLALAVFGIFWLAFLVDYLPVRIGGSEMPRSARSVVLLVTVGALSVLAWKYFVARYRRELPDDSLALLIERHHPEIAGRLITAVQLDGKSRQGDSHSPTFLKTVHREAVQQAEHVDLNRVFRREPIVKKLWLLVPMMMAALVMAIASPSTFGRAIGRLTLLSDAPWPRQAQLEMVGVEVPIVSSAEEDKGASELIPFEGQVLRLARGSSSTLRIRAAGEEFGHQIPELCSVSYVDDEGNRGQSNLRRVGRVIDGYQAFVLDGPPLTSLAKSVTLSVRGLDDRLSNYRIEAVQPPAISKMQMRVRYPDYLRIFDGSSSGGQASATNAIDQTLEYQAGVRIREGSDLELVGLSSVPLGEVDITVSAFESSDESAAADDRERGVQPIVAADRMSFSLKLDNLRQATSVRIVPRDPTGISAQAAYRYFIGVVRDQVPETTMRLSGIGSAITPIAKLPITATATDDYGIESMQVVMNLRGEKPKDSDTEAATQLHVLTPGLDRQGQSDLAIDLREMVDNQVWQPIKPGDTLTINTTAKDRFDLASPHITNGELTRLQVVTPEELLATLERRELEFRSRLEQSIDETRRLRQSLTSIDDEVAELTQPAEGEEQDSLRARQRLQLRIRQAELQASKTTEELAGIVSGIDDLLLEMVNNRIDSVDRRERLQAGVRNPLADVVKEPFPELRRQIVGLERIVMADETVVPDRQVIRSAVEKAVATNDQILLQLSAVLEKMLDLESFNEILDLMRGLIQDQGSLLEETEEAQKKAEEAREKRVLDLFK